MQQYRNSGGNSGVESYESGADYIKIKFKNISSIYLYNYAVPGKTDVDRMNVLAESSSGLNSYINRYVKNRFYSKS